MLKDGGMGFDEIATRVTARNKGSSSALKQDEVQSTVLKSVAQKMSS